MEDYIGDIPILILGNLGNVTIETPEALGLGESILTSITSFPSIELQHYLVDLLEALLTLYLFPVFASATDYSRHVYGSVAAYFAIVLSPFSALYAYFSALYSFLSALYSLLSALYSFFSVIYSCLSTLYSYYSTLCSYLSVLYPYPSTLHSYLSTPYAYLRSTLSILWSHIQRYNAWCARTNDADSFLRNVDGKALLTATRELLGEIGRGAATCERAIAHCVWDAFVVWGMNRVVAWTSERTFNTTTGLALPLLNRGDYKILKDLVVRSGVLVLYVFTCVF